MQRNIYRLHRGARFAYLILGLLLCLLVVCLPVGLFVFIRVARGRVEFTPDELTARALTSMRIALSDIERLGICEMPIRGHGIGGMLAKAKCGGDVGVNLCFLDRRGKTRNFIVSMFEDHQEIIDRVASVVDRPVETVTRSAFGLKWPEAG